MQAGTHIPRTRPPAILLLTVILVAVAALSLHTGNTTHAQTADRDGLSAPALTATATGPNTIELVWTIVPDVESYELVVWYAGAGSIDWQRIGGVLTGTSYTHRGLTADTTYYFHVRAVISGGATSKWSSQAAATTHASASGASTDTPTPTPTAPAQSSTTDTPTPTRPAGSELAAPALTAAGGAGEITLRWGAVAHAASYHLIVWDWGIKDWRDIGGVLTGTSYVHRGLTADTTYYFHILALAADGAMSKWSSRASATTHATGASTMTPAVTPTPAAAPTVATTERGALIALYQAAGGENWNYKDNWLSDASLGTWYGVTTDSSGRVIDLDLRGNGLSGSIPDLSALTSLTWLDLAYNTLSWPFPELGALSSLTGLDLQGTGLSGSIPDLSGLTSLTHLFLQNNQLSGEIPDLSGLTGLTTLSLSNNRLSGPIPYRDALPSLTYLSLANNQLSGTIPAGLGELAGLTFLSLAGNTLHGCIPASLRSVSFNDLGKLGLPDCAADTLTATPTRTPSELTAPVLRAEGGPGEITLTWNWVAQAASYRLVVWDETIKDWRGIGGVLTGTSYVHRGLTAATTYYFHIRAVDAGGAMSSWSQQASAAVSGPGTPLETSTPPATSKPTSTPTSTPNATATNTATPLVTSTPTATPATTDRGALEALYAATGGAHWQDNDNWLSNEPLNTWDRVATDGNGRVTALRMGLNQMSGQLPELSALTELNYLYFTLNSLHGPIPELSALTKSKHLFFNDNSLSGPIPELSALTALQRMNLSYNQLSGPIPDLSALTNLTLLDLKINQLSGEIPDLSALTSLTLLDLNLNELSGEIPDLSALTSLTHFAAVSNHLSGEIPDLSTLTSLRKLDLRTNQLSGEIPDLSALTSLTRLELSDNQLSGEIPDLSALTSLTRLDLSDNQLSGEIPDLSTLTSLTFLTLQNNQLSGKFPDLSTLTSLFSLNLNDNQLSGPVPDLSALTSLSGLHLGNNQLSGPLPDLSALTSLTRLTLSGNRFCLPEGANLSHPNSRVDAHLKSLDLPACTDADLSSSSGVPQNLTATVGSGEVTLTWDAVTNAAGYDLRTWDSINRKWETIGGALTATTIYTHTVQTDGRNYYYQVRSRDANNVRSAWSERVQAIIVPGPFPPPSLALDIIYQKHFEFGGVHVVAPSEVSDEKMALAQAIVTGMLSGNLDLFTAAPANKMRMAIFKENEAGERLIQLPEFRHIKQDTGGLMVWTANGRVVGGAPESDWRCDIFIHEFAHVIWFGVDSLNEAEQPGGQSFRQRVTARYEAAIEAGLWQNDYASWNAFEYWAETVRYWFQGKVPDFLVDSPTKLADYDPEAVRLIVEVFGDASVPEACQVPPSENQS